MHQPKKTASSGDKPRRKTDAELWGAKMPVLPAAQTPDDADRPDWYQDWLSKEKLEQDFVVWYDAWEAVELFIMFQFQWLHGFNGITGLNYVPIMAVIELRHSRKSKRLSLIDDINALELGAMIAFNESRKIAEENAEKERAKTK